MRKFYVYVHTCKANGKRYVGCTTQKPKYRWLEGRGYKHQVFEEAILKYGWDNFEHEVFEVGSKEEMYRKEVELISFYHSNDPEYGYNNSVGGEHGHLGCRHSEETKKRIAEAKKGRIFSEDHKKHMSEARKGKPKPRIKISLPDGTIIEMTKQNLVRNYINKKKEFEYVS